MRLLVLESPYGFLRNNEGSVSGAENKRWEWQRGARWPREPHLADSVGKRAEENKDGLENSDLTQDDVQGANHQQVALKLLADLLLDAVVHVRRVVRVELVDQDLLGQLDGQAVPVDGDLLHQLATLDPH